MIPGEIQCDGDMVTINSSGATVTLTVQNTGDRPIQVGSHFHFFEVNKALDFNREKAYGMRLDIPAGTAVRFEPGIRQTITLTPIKGARRVYGLNGLTEGPLDKEGNKEAALERAKQRGFWRPES
ncbi:urease subunit beta [Sulfobacillus thermosulfidooxidans]|uniref:urease subunit beta n=1 Tax=Sulfobacillus thermosulfidooxidans TaxID=28034 RepID=UPI00096BB365|nr:urease subunit beta [Sulfobacillus thermosulfidooxidans]OLZ08288.1 urease subunit beta [Sulfobacillus thermosulfidooxidans]OLZ13962.1 urease subunit beta [Sulfobacillus thermosulfidooxidans]OLZ19946.1 urease subunit beta [Sulfobacillus thermosulfidooxidans]